MKLKSGTMQDVVKMVCRKQGHRLGTMPPESVVSNMAFTMADNQSSTVTLNPTPPPRLIMCLACGATLAEIRGEE